MRDYRGLDLVVAMERERNRMEARYILEVGFMGLHARSVPGITPSLLARTSDGMLVSVPLRWGKPEEGMDGGGNLSFVMAWQKQVPSKDQNPFTLVSGSDDISLCDPGSVISHH